MIEQQKVNETINGTVIETLKSVITSKKLSTASSTNILGKTNIVNQQHHKILDIKTIQMTNIVNQQHHKILDIKKIQIL